MYFLSVLGLSLNIGELYQAVPSVQLVELCLYYHASEWLYCIKILVLLPVADVCSCSNGYLRAFLKGQDPKPDAMDYDQQYCGSAVAVRKLTTIKPRLLLVFSANGSRSGRGFKAKYNFVTGERSGQAA